MQTEEMESALAQLVGEVTGAAPRQLGRETRLDELGLDSLARIDLAVAAEDAFKIELPDEALERFATVGDLMDYLQRATA